MNGYILLTIEEYTHLTQTHNMSSDIVITIIVNLAVWLLVFLALQIAERKRAKKYWRFIYEHKMTAKYDDWLETKRKEWRID